MCKYEPDGGRVEFALPVNSSRYKLTRQTEADHKTGKQGNTTKTEENRN